MDMPSPSLYFFIVKPHDGREFADRMRVEVVGAAGELEAIDWLRRHPPVEGRFDARVSGWLTKEQLGDKLVEFCGVDPLTPITTAAALAFAEREHSELLTTDERLVLRNCARKIERHALSFLETEFNKS